MKKYEIMTICDLSLGEDGARDISNKVKDLISTGKGKVLDSDFWGKRTFSYEINHQKEGYYEVINFELDQKSLAEFKQKLNLINGLVRYLITATE